MNDNNDELRKQMGFDEQLKQFGSYKCWHPNGQLMYHSFFNMKDKRRHGQSKIWWCNGKLRSHVCHTYGGTYHGWCKYFDLLNECYEYYLFEHGKKIT